MGTKEALKHERPESVQILENLEFQWVHQDAHRSVWHGYIFVARNGDVIKFSYADLADHDIAWLKQQLTKFGFSV